MKNQGGCGSYWAFGSVSAIGSSQFPISSSLLNDGKALQLKVSKICDEADHDEGTSPLALSDEGMESANTNPCANYTEFEHFFRI